MSRELTLVPLGYPGHSKDEANDSRPERQESEEARPYGIGVGIWPHSNRGQNDDREQGPRPEYQEPETHPDQTLLQVLIHRVVP